MKQVSIQLLQAAEIQEAAKVAARAMAPNPFTMAIFRDREAGEDVMERVFKVMFGRFPGQMLVAKKDERVIGVMRMVEWPRCQMSLGQMLMILPPMLVSPRAAMRGMRGRSVWAKHHPKEAHLHLDPLAVAPEMQGQGVGSRLLKKFCEHLDEVKLAAYLETDRGENVRLYERFGFSVTQEALALGVRSYFMWRPAR